MISAFHERDNTKVLSYTVPIMKPIDLNAANILVVVSQTNSFRGAAIKLGIPKSTVSRKISELEARLGVELLKRSTRQVSMTEAGFTFVEAATSVLANLEAAEEAVIGSQKEPIGRIRISAPAPLGQMLLSGLVAEFMLIHPKIEVQLHLSHRQVDLIEEKFDIAIRFGNLADSSLRAIQIGSTVQRLVASPEYIKTNGMPKQLADLAKHECLLFGNNNLSLSAKWELHCESIKSSVPVKGRFATGDLLAVRAAAVKGLGIAMLPVALTRDEIELGQLIHILPNYCSEAVPLSLVHTGGQFVPSRVRLMVDFLAEKFRKQDKSGIRFKE